MQIACVIPTKRPGFAQYVAQNIGRQNRQPDLVILGVNQCGPFPAITGTECLRLPDDYGYAQACNALCDAAASRIDTGLICKMDDDDDYGPTYLARIEDGFIHAPESAIVGIYDVNMRWLYGNFKPCLAKDQGPFPRPAASVCGPTISINAEKWRAWPNFRFDPTVCNIYADQGLFFSLAPYGGIVTTIASGDFFYQRWPAEHNHGWRQPDPVE